MNKTCAELKTAAREKLYGNYGILILAFLIVQLINLIISIPFGNMIDQGTAFQAYGRVALGTLGSILVSVIMMVFSCGQIYMQLQVARGRKAELKDLLYCFKNRPDKYIGYTIFVAVISIISILPGSIVLGVGIGIAGFNPIISTALTVAGVILMIVGIVVLLVLSFAWSMAIYLMLDHQNLKVIEAMRTSRHMMKGFKWKYFKLWISFIGLGLLSLCTLGLALLWVQPYMTQAMTEFYLELDLATHA